jgi:NADH dehydrogenase
LINRRYLSIDNALQTLKRRQLGRYKQKLWTHPKESPFPYISTRSISTDPLPHQRGPVFRFVYRLFAYAGGFLLVSGGLVIAFFIYDASTYREDLSYTDIPVSEHALQPRRGGPKNLPIAEVLVDDDDCPENSRKKYKPKLVILGSGWGSVALLKVLNPEDYHVTVVSPVNYFLFTPMLPSATVGTLELRSLVEPIRRIVQRARGHFLKAEAVDVELSERLLEVAQTDSKGEVSRFYLPYDKLVVGVGKRDLCASLGYG